MIAKCVALLAVVAQINCYVVNSNCGSPVISSGYGTSGIVGSGLVGSSGIVGSGLVGSSGIVGTSGVVSSGIVGSSGVVGTSGSGASGAVTRNLVARGKYPVALENTGPVPDSRVPVSTSRVTAPVQEKPTVRLPARIPAPRTVAHSCTCYKQILRPRVHDQYITVPSVQRYIETTHKPVVENIHYEAVPVNCESSYTGGLIGGELASSGVQIASSQAVPVVAAAVESVPVSAGIEAVPVSTGYVSPVASTLQVGSSFPVRSISSGCGCQGIY